MDFLAILRKCEDIKRGRRGQEASPRGPSSPANEVEIPVRPLGKVCCECQTLLVECKSTFSPSGLYPKHYSHHHKSYEDLKICAQRACDLCALFLKCGAFETLNPYRTLDRESSSVLVGAFYNGPSTFWCLHLHIWISPDNSFITQELFSSRVFLTPVRRQGM
jgi:hypothetical protein